MRELMRANVPVLISYVDALLRGAGFEPVYLDRNMSVLEGSLGILPCRVLIDEADWDAARRHIINADLGHWIIEERDHDRSRQPDVLSAAAAPSGVP